MKKTHTSLDIVGYCWILMNAPLDQKLDQKLDENRRLPVQILISLFKDFFLFSKPIKKNPFKIIFSSEKYRQSWIRVKKKIKIHVHVQTQV